MKILLKIMMAGFSLIFMFSCAPALPGKGASQITVGIWNEFPDTPNYIRKKTFVFRHKTAGFPTNHFKQILTQSAGKYLVSKGYKIIEVQGKAALDQGQADMIVQIQPMDIYKQEGTRGYGFYDRKILEILIKQPARAYVCLNMTLHKRNSLTIKRSGRQESFSKLPLKELPDSPDQLTDEQKKSLSLILDETIRKTSSQALATLGL